MLATRDLLVALSIPIRSATLKARVIALLTEELESEVTIDTLEGHVFPRVAVSGRGVDDTAKGRTDVPPIITIERSRSGARSRDLMKSRGASPKYACRGCGYRFRRATTTTTTTTGRRSANAVRTRRRLQQVIIERFEAPDTVITLIPKRAGKQPKVFTVHHLVMDWLGINETMPYIARSPIPFQKGEIETSGTFGPWNVAHPARTPVTGKYMFANANLDTIEGLAGRAELDRRVQRSFNRIEVQGITDTPEVSGGRRRSAGSAQDDVHGGRRWLRR